jgi:glycosyltransferase involved in cell wall biosynthesis
MKTILHISADFPDPLAPAKTRAVANLLAATHGFRHVVYSLNRVSWKSGVQALAFGEGHVALAYGAPPYGLGLARYLAPVARHILSDIDRRGLTPDLVHAHKLSVEGLVAADVAKALGVPFIASIWGDTDSKIIGAKRGLRGRYREVADASKLLLPAAPWTARAMQTLLAIPAEHMTILPVMTAAGAIIAPRISASGNLVSMFSLDSWKRKGLDVLVSAMKAVTARRPDIVLDVYGSGSPRSFLEATAVVEQAGMARSVRLLGPLAHDKVQETMNGYAAFVMAPRRETFGMVHVEAALAGLPILWARDRGIDGLIDPSAGMCCDPDSVAEVASGIEQLVADEPAYKRALAKMQAEGGLRHLQREGIARLYGDILLQTTGRGQPASRELLMAAG